jgi:myo-inositol 2-dehydrogenase / D-chiro-inositol 1-dehydrogenase
VEGARLAAVADPVPERCRRVAPRAAAHGSDADLIEAGGIDVLILATPPGEHLAGARRAAAACIPTLVEKPPARDAAEAAELARFEPAPFVGFNRRFDPGLATLRDQLPDSGELNLELEVRTNRSSWPSYAVDADALLDLGPHLVDLARWLSGSEVERVRTLRLERHRAAVELEHGRGVAMIACALDRPYRERTRAQGPHGRLSARHVRGGLVRNQLTRLRAPASEPLVVSLAGELRELVRAARGEAAPRLATARDGVRVMAVIDAARRSAGAGGRWEHAG